MAAASKPPTAGATGKPCRHRASAAVGFATAPIATVAPTASVSKVLVIARPPLLRFDDSQAPDIGPGSGRPARTIPESSIPENAWHWHPSTIGFAIIE